jgi:ATP synthase F1 delta subunit
MSIHHANPVATRYAQATVQQALSAGSLPLLVQHTQTLLDHLTPESLTQLSLPTLRPAQRLALAQAVAAQLGLPPILANLLQLMAQAKRLNCLSDTLHTIVSLAAVHQGALPVHFQGAAALTDSQKTQLTEHLRTAFPQAKGFHITTSIVPMLRAGYRLFAAGKVWDASLTGRLQQLAAHLQQPGSKNT